MQPAYYVGSEKAGKMGYFFWSIDREELLEMSTHDRSITNIVATYCGGEILPWFESFLPKDNLRLCENITEDNEGTLRGYQQKTNNCLALLKAKIQGRDP